MHTYIHTYMHSSDASLLTVPSPALMRAFHLKLSPALMRAFHLKQSQFQSFYRWLHLLRADQAKHIQMDTCIVNKDNMSVNVSVKSICAHMAFISASFVLIIRYIHAYLHNE
jgi:hypothetical protein